MRCPQGNAVVGKKFRARRNSKIVGLGVFPPEALSQP
jgi:hypothetical protein